MFIKNIVLTYCVTRKSYWIGCNVMLDKKKEKGTEKCARHKAGVRR